MINTIFYFSPSKADYLEKWNSNDISARTICFVADEKSIYKAGVRYGMPDFTSPDIKDLIQLMLIENPYILPPATTTTLGGVIIGKGISVDQEGKISVNFSGIGGGDDLYASKTNYGLVKIGSGIDVNNGVISVSLIKGDKGDKGDTGAKGDKGDTGSQGPLGPEYNDTELRNLIDGNITELQNLINGLNDRIKRQIENLLKDAQWLEENFPDTDGDGSGGGSVSNFGTSDVERYLQTIGVWAREGDITKYQWSTMQLGINDITMRVAALETNSSTGNGQALTAEQLLAISKINGLETAVAQLTTSYSLFSLDEDKELKIIRWLASTLNLGTNANATWAELYSAVSSATTDAISALQTRVTLLEGATGTMTEANLSSMVQNKINELIASSGFVSQAYLDNKLNGYATAAMYATLGDYVDSAMDRANSAAAGLLLCAKYATDANGNIVEPRHIEGSAKLWADQIDLSAAHKLTITSANQIAISSAALDAILGDVHVKAGNVDWTAGTYTITANHLDLTGANINLNATDIKLGNYMLFSQDTTGGSTVDYAGRSGLFTSGSSTVESIDPNYYDGGSINIHKNRIIIGSKSGGDYNLSGVIAADILLGGYVSANMINSNSSVNASTYNINSGGKYNISTSLGYYIDEQKAKVHEVVADKITLNGYSITSWPSGGDSGSSVSGATATIECLNGTMTVTNGVVTAFSAHNNNLTLSLS